MRIVRAADPLFAAVAKAVPCETFMIQRVPGLASAGTVSCPTFSRRVEAWPRTNTGVQAHPLAAGNRINNSVMATRRRRVKKDMITSAVK
ncbi:hypothetical protein KPZU09_14020 [Klebsiella pneumoniae]|uniref:Uncharacterized protein n=1 Tax=Klebsiella pneumoniae TaxID=573 RepID=A0A919HMN8_KLEPN|nr:hypothetical protein KPZU09_14020 [Klebsiella pneumoniae]